MHNQALSARLTLSTPLSAATKHLQFEVEAADHFDFTAGQWVSMRAEDENVEHVRAYSIASAPCSNNRFEICLNRVEDGFFSNYLCDLDEGSEVKFVGPYGHFILRQPVRDSLFIATGTGIAPIRAMVQWLFASLERHEGREFWLIFGVRNRSDLYYHDEFTELRKVHSNFHYIPTLSGSDPDWEGARGYVQQHVPAIARGCTDMDAYICGLKEMVKANRKLLAQFGWERNSIFFEKYN